MALPPLSRGSSLTLCILDKTCGKPPVRAKIRKKECALMTEKKKPILIGILLCL
jgi:hypothetical protein